MDIISDDFEIWINFTQECYHKSINKKQSDLYPLFLIMFLYYSHFTYNIKSKNRLIVSLNSSQKFGLLFSYPSNINPLI